MRHNRLAGLSDLFQDVEPRPSAPIMTPGSCVGCPWALVQGLTPEQRSWQSMIYALAYQQAEAAARPSFLERDLLGVWN